MRHEKKSQHHLTFTRESGELKGTYMSQRNLPDQGAKGELLAAETEDVLDEYDSLDTIQAILVDNTSTNTGITTFVYNLLYQCYSCPL